MQFFNVFANVRECVCAQTAASAYSLYSALPFQLIYYVSVLLQNVFHKQLNKQTKKK